MAIPDLVKQVSELKVKKWCDQRVPAHVQDKLKYKHRLLGKNITIFECRPNWRNPKECTKMKVVQFRFSEITGKWSLYFIDRNDKSIRFKEAEPKKKIEDLIDIVENDKTGAFFG